MRAGQLYSLYRVDHALGFYRTYFRSTDGKQSGFVPPNERGQIALRYARGQNLPHRAVQS